MLMKKYLIIFLFLLPLPLFSIGYNTNIELGVGIAESFGSEQIEHNRNIWNNFTDFGKYLNYCGGLSADVIFSQNAGAEVGVKYKMINLNYETQEIYANDEVHLNFSIVQIPILFKYSIPILKTVDVISALNIAGGINGSIIVGNQIYVDSITRDNGNFISPFLILGQL